MQNLQIGAQRRVRLGKNPPQKNLEKAQKIVVPVFFWNWLAKSRLRRPFPLPEWHSLLMKEEGCLAARAV
jgi:hypothetical protein